MVYLSAGQLDGPARSDPDVRAAVGRTGRLALLWLIVGLALLTAAAGTAIMTSSASDQLRQSGGQTTGIVTALRPDRRYQDGSADVRYTVDGQQHTGVQDLGANTENYYVGETVTVYYDLEHPSRFTINNETNQPIWSVWLMIFMLVAGLVGLIPATSYGRRWRRLWRVLSRCAWQPAWFVPVPGTRRGRSIVRVQLLGPDGGGTGEDVRYRYRSRTSAAGQLFGRRPDISSSTSDPWHGKFHVPGRVAGPRGNWVVLADQQDSSVLVSARRQSG